MSRRKKRRDAIALDPEQRVCPQYDSTGMKKFPAGEKHISTGPDVKDNCACGKIGCYEYYRF